MDSCAAYPPAEFLRDLSLVGFLCGISYGWISAQSISGGIFVLRMPPVGFLGGPQDENATGRLIVLADGVLFILYFSGFRHPHTTMQFPDCRRTGHI